MKIGILGTRGIPNYHGGFEQFAENFSVYAANKGHDVYVYNSSLHPYKEKEFKGVNIIQAKDWEDTIGTAGQFVYDFNSILDARSRNFDVLLQLGYTSSAVWFKFLPKNSIIITNMDGLEWKRSKYSKSVQKFLKWSEKKAVESSDYLISDSLGIQNYLQNKYQVDSEYIAYGADVFQNPNSNVLSGYNVKPYEYQLLIARMEPENNIETILEGYEMSTQKYPILIIGDANKTTFGQRLLNKFQSNPNILFLGSIYDLDTLNNLRYYSRFYFHGHSVGGTNPSLLEAMGAQAQIVAHDNEFNRAILENDAYYFSDSSEVTDILNVGKRNAEWIQNNVKKIEQNFSWNKINEQYLSFMEKLVN